MYGTHSRCSLFTFHLFDYFIPLRGKEKIKLKKKGKNKIKDGRLFILFFSPIGFLGLCLDILQVGFRLVGRQVIP